MNTQPKFAVIGGGSWATAIVKMLCENVDQIAWYMRSIYALEHLKLHKHNPNYLSSVAFDINKLQLTNDINKAIQDADYVIFAIPSAFLSAELEKMTESLEGKIVFSAIKGIVPESSLIVGEHFHTKYNIPYENIGVITGPCHAEEVALERLSYLTIACGDMEKAKVVATNFSSYYIKTKTSDDIVGTEYAAVLKNIYSIAAGIAHGLGYGDNFQAVLMSNAIREMKRFIKQVHRMKRNINNSAYLGDLLVTGYSVFSRNRMFGNMIGKGYTVKSAQMEMSMVAEGYYATKSAWTLNQKYEAKTPILDAVYQVLYENKEAKKVFKKLTEKLD
ncbi:MULTISPECIES: NAD(P)H-dependent glycerol-3-phosphate dehydrogenase [Flavobacterium]|uniref:Glycerol-3-phosphate dehydrogenase n=2 Tax=Flavobacterium TaxID=237 RepID=A0AA94F4J1_9FLAO|nr:MULTISPECIES: NAD(P)H-dependent glycerol-3-phosphate dehydrogenase [Flavobacterium]OXA80083.1 glycerol-3-phosphate dehydrogenase [Flavobacterium columnare NBRC 100251 = ATCC 23463]AMA48127.1 glycerol-3-phosphate dehydrogenase [Flavobacterium covae]AND63735.1 glycerol-3-phosphate dehydrogenase [Flavobacterium covae]MCH4830039.1 NAD(P)H-dependent glycerol-3-phosphate dehydrogenase [Flavobacterium columnare]MCH4832581.1 NAD(P)H-dependent glycerol-3-phosphate dehydrogenase [Flavobacterium colum